MNFISSSLCDICSNDMVLLAFTGCNARKLLAVNMIVSVGKVESIALVEISTGAF